MSTERNEDVVAERTYVIPTDYGVEVYRTKNDLIAIKQDDPLGNEEIVTVSPDRVELVIEFLRAVREEILADRADEDVIPQGPPGRLNGRSN